jgi:hypothetical protein
MFCFTSGQLSKLSDERIDRSDRRSLNVFKSFCTLKTVWNSCWIRFDSFRLSIVVFVKSTGDFSCSNINCNSFVFELISILFNKNSSFCFNSFKRVWFIVSSCWIKSGWFVNIIEFDKLRLIIVNARWQQSIERLRYSRPCL